MRYKQEPAWQTSRFFFKNSAPKNRQHWLVNKHSLTQLLTCTCLKQQDNFQVKLINETWAKPQRSEAHLLGMKPNELGFVRQVYLCCGNTPWVYARSVIPQSTLHGELQKLTKLGNQPLGAVLFANRHISRGSIEIAKLTKKHTMFDTATRQTATPTDTIWGRRSVFTIADKPLLVSELFLTDLP